MFHLPDSIGRSDRPAQPAYWRAVRRGADRTALRFANDRHAVPGFFASGGYVANLSWSLRGWITRRSPLR
jgi:hypothetical protein